MSLSDLIWTIASVLLIMCYVAWGGWMIGTEGKLGMNPLRPREEENDEN